MTADAVVGAACQGLRLAAILGLRRCGQRPREPVPTAALRARRPVRDRRGRHGGGVVHPPGDHVDRPGARRPAAAGAGRLRVRPGSGDSPFPSSRAPSNGRWPWRRRWTAAASAAGPSPPARQRLASAATLAGLLGLAVGVYGVLDAGAPPELGLPVVGVGAAPRRRRVWRPRRSGAAPATGPTVGRAGNGSPWPSGAAALAAVVVVGTPRRGVADHARVPARRSPPSPRWRSSGSSWRRCRRSWRRPPSTRAVR